MPIPKKPKLQPYQAERQRLLQHLSTLAPEDDDYETVLTRIDKLDKILNRSSELTKTVIPALGTVASVASIYALQQFAGVLVPKALETIASRSTQKTSLELN